MQSLISLVTSIGYIGLFIIIFLECGFPATFFLPGDSLLFATGFLASGGHLSIAILIPTLFVAGVLGYICNYWISKFFGPKIFNNTKSFWFNPKRLEKAHEFFEKYGAKTILLGRFVPVVRSFAPAVAGAAGMSYKKFMIYNVLGGIFWAGGMTLIGFFLGKTFPQAHLYLTPIIVGIVFVSVLPSVVDYISNRKKHPRIPESN